jgi:DNA-binding CsgD family transcriptional regulator
MVIDRARELGQLREISGTATRAARVIELRGQPWAGKTWLLARFGEELRGCGWTTLAGRAGQAPAGLPFGAITDALEDVVVDQRENLMAALPACYVRHLAAAFPSLASADRGDDELAGMLDSASATYEFYRAVGFVLRAVGRAGGLLLGVDDAHNLDGASLGLLSYLYRHSPGDKFVVVLAYRPRQAGPGLLSLLGEIASDTGRYIVDLQPVPDRDATELLPDGLGSGRASEILHEASGNLGLLRAFGSAHAEAYADQELAELLPHDVAAACLREFHLISPKGYLVAQAAAVAGEPLEPELLSSVAGLSVSEIWSALDELIDHDVMHRDGAGGFRFRHSLLRSAAYGSAGAGWRLGAHGRAASVLASRDASAGRIAVHLSQAATTVDLQQIQILLTAARDCLFDRPLRAVVWIRAAVRSNPSCGRAPAQRLILGQALALAGRLVESHDELSRVETISQDPLELAELAEWRARVLGLLGRHDDAKAPLFSALAMMPAGATIAIARVRAALLAADLEAGRAEDLPATAEAVAVTLTTWSGGPELRAYALALLAAAAVASDSAETQRCLARLRQAVSSVNELSDDQIGRRLETLYWVAHAETALDLAEAARDHLTRGLHLADTHRLIPFVPVFASRLGSLIWSMGDTTSAVRWFDLADRNARATDSAHLSNLAQSARMRAGQLPAQGLASTDERINQRLEPYADAADEPELSVLSERELGIAVLVSNGRTNQQIARTLGLSHKTVETYLSRIFNKLGLCSRSQVATLIGRTALPGTCGR